MPRPVDPPSSPSASPDSGSFLCDRIQQFRQRMRSRCFEAHRAAATGSADAQDVAPPSSSLPCLLQSWRKRIEAMDDDEPQTDRHRAGYSHQHFGHHHRRPCHTSTENESTSTSTSSSSSSACGGFPFRGPRMLHPRLERQQATCSLSGIWSGFTSSSPPPSPEIYAKSRRRRHPYSRCHGRGSDATADDHGKSSAE